MDLNSITDIDQAVQIAKLYEAENKRLHKEVRRLMKELAEATGMKKKEVQGELDALLKRVDAGSAAKAERKAKSERRRTRRRSRNGEKKKRSKDSHGPTKQVNLPHEEERVELPPDDQKCHQCGLALEEMKGQTEDSETIISIERRYVVKEVKRQKYRPTCTCGACTIVTAPKPDHVITLGGRYALSFLAQVAYEKFVMHLPLNRQLVAMKALGLEITSQSLVHQMWKLAQAAEATYFALQHEVLQAAAVHIDETGWKSMDDIEGVHMLWGMTSKMGAFYTIQTNRSHEGVHAMLLDYDGFVLSDGLNIYKTASKKYGFTLAGCWAHARRYFFKAEPNFPDATPFLDWMDELFRIERELGDADATLDEILARREKDSKPIIDKLHQRLYDESLVKKRPAGTDISAATGYLSRQWEFLTLFLTSPEVPLSNNDAERALRPAVIGRKNYGGTRSRKGELVATRLYTIVETARIRGINPKEYLFAIGKHYAAVRKNYRNVELEDPEVYARFMQEAALTPTAYLAARDGPT